MDGILLEKEIKNEINIQDNNFLQTTLGQTINSAVDIGLKVLLPDFLEDQIIDVKDTFIKQGFKEGVNSIVENAINLGKSAIGIFTGNFENIEQVDSAIKKGGLIDSISGLLDKVIDGAKSANLINKQTAKIIKDGKNTILDTINNNIEDTLSNQVKSIDKLNTYAENWKNYYNEKNFEGMEKEYKKIENKMKEVIPLENTIKRIHEIENIHELIKNNGRDFNLSSEELELTKKLI